MVQFYKEQPSYSFPSKLDMLAQFGLEPEEEDDALPSLSYRFGSKDGVEILLVYSVHIHFVDVSMYVAGEMVFTIATHNAAEMRIGEKPGASWLQVIYEEGRNLPDLFIHVEPRLKCRWA